MPTSTTATTESFLVDTRELSQDYQKLVPATPASIERQSAGKAQSRAQADDAVEAGNPPMHATGLFQIQPPVEGGGELLRHRFLCRKGSLLLVGNTGIGKSSLTTQLMMHWAVGAGCLGIVPAGPLKSLLIQGENDELDLIEMRDGVAGGMALDAERQAAINDNVVVWQETGLCGENFCNQVVAGLLEEHRPDLLWIDPVLQYLGGDGNNQEAVGYFLRQLLSPLIHQHNCGLVLIHHTAKPKPSRSASPASLSAYDAAGSAEFSNWPRAVLSLKSTSRQGQYSLIAGKRGNRLNWKLADGVTAAYERSVRHSIEPGVIYWLDGDEAAAVQRDNPQAAVVVAAVPPVEEDAVAVLAHIPPTGQVEKKQLISTVKQRDHLGEGRIREAVKRLVASGRIQEIKQPRPNRTPAVMLQRVPVPPLPNVVHK